ncbi:MAG: hypothetical protein QOG68_2066, partial [Solirubrobacteraceae bacterium]|nr:hypothetical protein [Solirubrobacteraceae bacterium]
TARRPTVSPMRGTRLCVLVAMAAVTAPAAAYTTQPPKPKHVPTALIPWTVRVTGVGMSVEYHGDAAAGCAAHGLCDTSGTAKFTIADGSGTVLELAQGSKALAIGFLQLAWHTDTTQTTAGATERCSDRSRGALVPLGFDYHSTFVFGLLPVSAGGGAEFFSTRCGGPTLADVAAALPRAQLPKHFGHRKTIRLPLAGTRPWTGKGFAGSVTATGVAVLRRPSCKKKAHCSPF